MAFLTALAFPTGYKIPNTDVRVTIVATNKGPWNADAGLRQGGHQPDHGAGGRPRRGAPRHGPGRGAPPQPVRTGRVPVPDERRPQHRLRRLPPLAGQGARADGATRRPRSASDEAARARAVTWASGSRSSSRPRRPTSPGRWSGGFDTSTVRMDPSGRVTVLTGVTTPGGGNDTGIAQIVADELGVPLEVITSCRATPTCARTGSATTRAAAWWSAAAPRCSPRATIRAKLAAAAAVMLEAIPASWRSS